MAFIGTPLDTRNTFQSLQGKRFNGDGSETDFTLDVAPSSTLDIEVFVGNVRQDPNSAYTLSGTTLTFTGAPPSGTNNIYVVHQAKAVGTIEVPSSYKSDSQNISGARTFTGNVGVTTAKDLGTGIHVRTSDSGSSVNANFDELVLESSGNAGLSILTATDGFAGICFGDSGDNQIGSIIYNHGDNSMQINTSAAVGIKIDGNGHITKPKQPSFLVSAATQSNVTGDNTDYDLLFTNEIIDRNADYGSSLFTAPVTGLYQLSASLYLTGIAANHTSVFVSIVTSNRRQYIVGVDGGATDPADSGEAYFNGSALFDMDANDTAKIQIDVRGGSKVVDIGGGTDGATFFSGALIA